MKRSQGLFLLTLTLATILYLVPGVASAETESTTPASSYWLWDFLGRLHPLMVHFPITLLLLAAILEFFSRRNFNSALRPGINVLVFAGAVAAVLSVFFGWLLSTQGEYGAETLLLHQWSGYVTALLGVGTGCLLFLIINKNRTALTQVYRFVLLLTAVGVSVAGHIGAMLTHGDDFLTSTLPWASDYSKPFATNFDLASSASATLSAEQQRQLLMEVKGIFAHNCYSCHGPKKVKGELRLDKKHMAMKGGKDGKVIIPGNPDKSEILRRVLLPRSDKEAMPSKGKMLQKQEIDLIRYWIAQGAPWPDSAGQANEFRVAKLEPRKPVLPAVKSDLTNPVDLFVDDYFSKNKINWPSVVDDRIFLRRIYLDIIGMLPSPAEQEAFLKDQRVDKRSLSVKELLNRNDDYAQHWLTFWNDALRNDYTGTGYIDNGRSNITDWLYKSLQSNMPYNQFVKELLSPTAASKGFIEGIKWRGAVNASQVTQMQAAQNVSQVFLGLNLKCASCHNSFISDWKLEDAYAFANIFSDSTLEINRCDKPTGKKAGTRILWSQLGKIDSTANKTEKLRQMAERLVQPANGRLYRTIVNRMWAQLLGRGLVEPLDQMDNEPWSQDLLDWLASDFTEGGHDLKKLIYVITTSRTYQLSSVGAKDANALVARDFKFSGRIRKRISGEQFSDALTTILVPVYLDSVAQYRPVKKNPTGESVRASLVANNAFLTALGRPNRETVSTGRESQANLLQALELTNGTEFNAILKRGAIRWVQVYPESEKMIGNFFRVSLGRDPTKEELTTAVLAIRDPKDLGAVEDLFWSVFLLPEFQIVY